MYNIPLNPTDLVEIYKVRSENPDYVLAVNYTASKEHLTPTQILTYLANTGFTPKFDSIDDELVDAYIKLPFVLEAPELAQAVAGQVLNYLEGGVYTLGTSVLEELTTSLSEVVPFCVQSVNDFAESSFTVNIETVEVYKQDSVVGVNLLYIIMFGLDVLIAICQQRDIKGKYNASVFTDEPRYGGRDLYHALASNNLVAFLLVNLLPGAIHATDSE